VPLETVSETVLLIEVQTPAALSTDQIMNTETTVTMPKAIESRNEIFMTDQGSIRLSRRRARRGARAAAFVVRRVVTAAGAATGAEAGVGSQAASGAGGAGAAVVDTRASAASLASR